MKKNGFTLLEISIIMAIVLILGTIAIPTVSGVQRKYTVKEVESKLPLFLRGLLNKSYNSGNRYELLMDLDNKEIKVYNSTKKNCVGNLRLPGFLTYENKDSETKFKDGITETGNFSKGFNIYVMDQKKQKVYLRISADKSTELIQYGRVRIYRPKTGEFVDRKYRSIGKMWNKVNGSIL